MELRRFVGLCNYYRRFVSDFAAVAAPLTRLCSPHAVWTWEAAEQSSFDTLKDRLSSAPVLRPFDPSRGVQLTITNFCEFCFLTLSMVF